MPDDSSTHVARAALAAEQARLVGALTGAAGPPDGFDAARIEAAAASLLSKRMHAAARAWPTLAEVMGEEQFRRRFLAYAAGTSYPHDGGPGADVSAFADALDRAGHLPERARLERLAARWRRGFPLRAAMLNAPRRLLLALRLPRIGVRFVAIPLSWPHRG